MTPQARRCCAKDAGAQAQRIAVLHESPYYGAIGGETTFSFTQTSLGVIVKCKHAGTNTEIELTDYACW